MALKEGSGIIVYQDGIKYRSRVKVFKMDIIELIKQPTGTITN